MLGEEKAQLVNAEPIRRFLFEHTQHRIGGFGKAPGNPPGSFLIFVRKPVLAYCLADIYHSYLGLAALATMKEPGIKPLDPALCISAQQREKIDELRKRALVPTRGS
jgi:geranylgeranyl transferase type-1 subunit beta